ncbi:hypothetical protein HAP48_0035185 [Bradyrhizobium septentrionale]|uniref:Holliday junction resolvasome RuvABC endonuclease subunit n=1 Tax=Bradyrhizobium septentrionale TaxID=1404411 RepID=A0A973W073_9BRAD|nr:hypothetical protein [Bradyrhizobium septentrionale]UGY13779.1 hypothetical protein HAP48_0035185 [Bradyrhizobium septentrionale]
MSVILALDLASRTGWAVGEPGQEPAHGSIQFAKPGASHEASFSNAWGWMYSMLADFGPSTVVWEAPMPTSFNRGKSNVNTTTLLYGLPAIIGACAYRCGLYDIRKAETRDVRLHFIGQNPKRDRAKTLVIRQCRSMGWEVEDDNEADALATWHYMCSLIRPQLALVTTPLFQQGRR